MDARAQELADFVAEYTDKFVGPWLGYATTAAGARLTTGLGVGTIGDVTMAYSALGEIYPYNLCVISVAYSSQDLENVVDALRSTDPEWPAIADPATDQVVVTAIAFDSHAQAILSRYRDKVRFDTLVRPVESPQPTPVP